MQRKNETLATKILEVVNEAFKNDGRILTGKEIAELLGISPSTASRYLSYLSDNGLIDITDRYRGIRTSTMNKMLNAKRRAPILGRIACGEPMFAEENIEGYITLPEELLGSGEYFCLWAEGDSMIKVGIKPGDLVICRKQSSADEGQIVVALCDNEYATLKRLYLDKDNERFRLHPENDSLEDMFFKSVEVQGVAVKVLASLE